MRNSNWKTDKPTGVLLALIRKALWGEEFAWTEEIDWEKVFSLALKHGVAAVVYETVKALPKGQRPPFEILLRWDVTTEMVRQGYRKRHAALLHLRDILAPKGIKIVVLKGESLAINYPDPECRECGDVDIILPGAYEEGNRIMEEMGIKVDYHNDRHSIFKLDGVMFENHVPETTAERFKRFDRLTNEYLNNSLSSLEILYDGIYVASPAVRILFQICHMARHVDGNQSNPLRSICDITLLLKKNSDIINSDEFNEMILTTGLSSFFAIVLDAIEKTLRIKIDFKGKVRINHLFSIRFIEHYLMLPDRTLLETFFRDFFKIGIMPYTVEEKRRYLLKLLRHYAKSPFYVGRKVLRKMKD